MNKARGIDGPIPRVNTRSVHYMITKSLGYCCPWAFFRLFKKDQVIADRLGVTRPTIKEQRLAATKSGCRECDGCVREALWGEE